MKKLGIDMMLGDARFFHDKLIHSYYRNNTPKRWRLSFICHYVGRHANKFEALLSKPVSHLGQDGPSRDM